MSKKSFQRVIRLAPAALGVLLWAAGPCRADAPASNPAPIEQPDSGAQKVVVAEVNGMVQVRADPQSPWQKATAGMTVGQNAEFRTGPRSSVTCVIPPDQTFTLDRLGIASVAAASKSGKKVTTEVMMKYGRMDYKIEAAGLEHESTIVSPSSTLAIRGTTVSLYDQPPFDAEATSYTGVAMFQDYQRLAAAAVGSKGGSKATITAGNSSAAQTALGHTVVNPGLGGAALTASDEEEIAEQVARGGVVSYDPFANIPVVTNSPPLTDAQLVKALPGPLDFVIRWNGPADINLELFVEKGNPLTIISQGFQPTEFLYPGFGCNVTPDGGYIAYDNRGGPKGGMEIASFPSVPAEAAYGIAALFITGKPVDVTIDAFINGQKGQIFFLANPNNVNSLTIANQEVQKLRAPGDFATANFTIPALFPSGSAKQAAKHKANSDAEAVSAVAPTPTLAASGRR